MRHTDAQPIANVVEIVFSGEQPQKVGILQLLNARERRLVWKERPALRLSHDEFVETFGDVVGPPFGKRLQPGQPRHVLFSHLKECKPAMKLFIVELQYFHVVRMPYLLHASPTCVL